MPLNKFQRLQSNFKLEELYPSIPFKCACGCGLRLTGRRTRWATDQCVPKIITGFLILSGNVQVIRHELYKKQEGYCQKCGLKTDDWEADHIIPVHKGGGLENFQTLCKDCHKEKTALEMAEYRTSSC